MTTAWMVRAGGAGEREDAALADGCLIAGWEELADLSDVSSKSDLRALVDTTYPDASPARAANWTGQVWRLIHDMTAGDYVVTPLKRTQEIAIGRIAGPYHYRADAPAGFRHTRPVTWIRKDLPRSSVRQDLLDSMGSLLTICRLERFGAASRIDNLATDGVDPGAPDDNNDAQTGSKLELAEQVGSKPDRSLKISVRELLANWGAIRRSASTVALIELELKELGLTSRPHFTEVGIDDKVSIFAVGAEPNKDGPNISGELSDQDAGRMVSPLAPRVGVIQSASSNTVLSVRPEDPISRATTLMIAHEYSQLAVVTGDGDTQQLLGAISWASIGRHSVAAPLKHVRDAMFRVTAVHHRDLLLPVMEEIYRKDFLFVRSDDSPLSGIVTTADLSLRFGQTTRPLVLIEEAERRLRARAEEIFTLEDFRSAKVNHNGRRAPTLGNYVKLFETREMWERLKWPVDYEFFRDRLAELTAARNDFMHFTPDPISEEQLESLESFVRLLRVVDARD